VTLGRRTQRPQDAGWQQARDSWRTAPRAGHALGCTLALFALAACPGSDDAQGGDAGDSTVDAGPGTGTGPVRITGAHLDGRPRFTRRSGDLWRATWADDDLVYVGWGDATGRGNCCPRYENVVPDPSCTPIPDSVTTEHVTFQLHEAECTANHYCKCHFTDAGLGALFDPATADSVCQEACIVTLDVPTGTPFQTDDPVMELRVGTKPTGLLFYNGRMYWAGVSPTNRPPPESSTAPSNDYGYIAYSDDYGHSWIQVPSSPWGSESASFFANRVFINMGKAYELNTDGYVYALAKDFGAWTFIGAPFSEKNTDVYLTRVPRDPADGTSGDPIIDYDAYVYFAGVSDGGEPIWSSRQADAQPLEGLRSPNIGGAIYHPGTRQYLWLSAIQGGLFAAPNPWGPWTKVADPLREETLPSDWAGGGYIPCLLSKGVTDDGVYFTIAGVDGPKHYELTIGHIILETASP